jgi:hypothetical protein
VNRALVDVDVNAGRYLRDRDGNARYASFDYCFNYFQDFRDDGRVGELAAPAQMQTSCLQLGFYLASWGMFRGKAELLNHSARRLVPVIEAIVAAPAAVWTVDADDYGPAAQRVLFDVRRQLAAVLPGGHSTTLVTKTMLGVFGCVPAYDRFFRVGFGAATFGPTSLRNIEAYCHANAPAIERHRVSTIDFTTGAETDRRYTKAKVIDMVLFTAGQASGGAETASDAGDGR